MATLESLVEEWLRLDQNPSTRSEIQDLWDTGNYDELEKRMRNRIEFGTAGLRGKMEAGWSRMNDLIVIQASQGLCAYVLDRIPTAAERGVVVGYDHRHNSERWGYLTAAAFIAMGVKVHLLKGLVHTPLVPFGVKKLNAACGVMITASHNPKQDNGYKVYWENAIQIISPHDEGISEYIIKNLTPLTWDINTVTLSPLYRDTVKELRTAYFEEHILSLSYRRSLNGQNRITFVNTSMHGVSDSFLSQGFSTFGLAPYTPVVQQQHPDPDFPTVKFPNPEEKGALDLAIKTAEQNGVQYVLAQDPDSDRFAAAERSAPGSWKIFTGDQLGTLFAAQALEIYKTSGKSLAKLAMVASTVSSKMIASMAQAEGFHFAECLTGFKYIGNTALDLERKGFEVPFGYEEAIGFMFGGNVRDKDGVAAALRFAELVGALHSQGKTPSIYLEELYEKYGHFQTSNSYFICNDPQAIVEIFTRLRSYNTSDPSYPSTIAGFTINRVIDLTIGYDSENPPSFKPFLPTSPGQMIQFRAREEQGTTIVLTIRTSGTEPKIKYYLEGSGASATLVRAKLQEVVAELSVVWLQARRYNLGQP
ncbi:hypothetical protein AX16_004213 [Volvariella volvacea WC 439]|nr:hypothetical protein AX16_004213 [Volvariella volvacea WC 439]